MEPNTQTFPRLTSGYYWRIWEQFQKKVPSVLDAGSFAFLGTFSTSSFRTNVLAHLRLLGFVGDGDKPTDLVWKWRNPDTHREACDEIINSIYPQALLDAYPEVDTPQSSISRWFQNQARQGEKTAEASARMFTLLRTSDPEQRPAKTDRPASQERKSATRVRSTKGSNSPKIEERNSPGSDIHQQVQTERPPTDRPIVAPSIHLDIQFHLSPEMSADQIDQIFASMSKHLKGWQIG